MVTQVGSREEAFSTPLSPLFIFHLSEPHSTCQLVFSSAKLYSNTSGGAPSMFHVLHYLDLSLLRKLPLSVTSSAMRSS